MVVFFLGFAPAAAVGRSGSRGLTIVTPQNGRRRARRPRADLDAVAARGVEQRAARRIEADQRPSGPAASGTSAAARKVTACPPILVQATVSEPIGSTISISLSSRERHLARRRRRPRCAPAGRRARRRPAAGRASRTCSAPSGTLTSVHGEARLPAPCSAVEEIHRRRADEAGDEQVDRLVVDRVRRRRAAG